MDTMKVLRYAEPVENVPKGEITIPDGTPLAEILARRGVDKVALVTDGTIIWYEWIRD
jgi:hypothetical protein